MAVPTTLFDKIWSSSLFARMARHCISIAISSTMVWVTPSAGLAVRRPDRTFATVDRTS
jgi:hypothetical protein